ncbi:MAG: winged helix-turn-helix domain-containing protein [Rhizobiaceae bacterium]
MRYEFENCEIDTAIGGLHRDGIEVPLEPQSYALLVLLIENRERLITKDELVEKIWNGRIVSDAAVSSCVKLARKAVGDDGTSQRIIRTLHGRGFRFIADVVIGFTQIATDTALPTGDTSPGEAEEKSPQDDQRPSIAILPFRLLGQPDSHGAIADAIPHELISALAKLRWLFVIARGSTFRFRSTNTQMDEVGQILGARYILSGVVEIFGNKVTVAVELTDTRSAIVIWAERYSSRIDSIHEIREQIAASVVTAMDIHIPVNEARVASLRVPEDLDCWAAYHLALQHMYRFNQKDNLAAERLFARAIELDPGFARAHAGMSFVYFQNAFQHLTDDPVQEIQKARAFAERSVELDPLDPFANFTHGRFHWLTGDLEASLPWLERSVTLSPNYAQGLYASGWTHAISGSGTKALKPVETAMALSPIDPFFYAMQATLAFSCMNNGEHEKASQWANRAAHGPGAHYLIAMIALAACSLAGDTSAADAWSANVKSRRPDADTNLFFHAFPIPHGPLRESLRLAFMRNGIT